MMHIRNLQADDADSVAKMMVSLVEHIRDESNDPYFDWEQLNEDFLRSAVLETLHAADRQFFIAQAGNRVAGFLEAAVIPCFLPFSRIEKVGQIFAAYIEPEYRGQGLIESLEAEACRFFSSLGIKYSELHVLSKNSIAARTWERLGYVTFREQRRKYL